MEHAPSHVEVLDPVDRWLHLAAILGFAGAMLSAPLLELPRLALQLGIDKTSLVAVHGLCGALLLALWSFHLVRICLAWLEGRDPTGLLPRPADFGALAGTLLRGSSAAPRNRFTFRERFPYLFFLLAVPILSVSGWAVAHPATVVGMLGGRGLLTTAALHSAVGLLCVPPLVWHLYFAQLQPGVLFWNSAWLTGRSAWPKVLATRPEWAASLVRQYQPENALETEIPSVEALLAAGNTAGQQGEFKEAAASYRQALELYPGYAQAWFNLGVVLFRGGDHPGADQALRQFLQQDPFGPMASKAREILARLEGEGA